MQGLKEWTVAEGLVNAAKRGPGTIASLVNCSLQPERQKMEGCHFWTPVAILATGVGGGTLPPAETARRQK